MIISLWKIIIKQFLMVFLQFLIILDIAISHATPEEDELNTVVTVPLEFTSDQRVEVAEAATEAGFHVVQVKIKNILTTSCRELFLKSDNIDSGG